jgi:hypothetical protein
MKQVKIDAGVLLKVKDAFGYLIEHAKLEIKPGNYLLAEEIRKAEKALTLLETAQTQPEVTDDGKVAALSCLNYFVRFMETVPPDGYVMADFFKESSLETIRAALQSPAVQEVTWQELADYLSRENLAYENVYAKAICKSFKIIRGEK